MTFKTLSKKKLDGMSKKDINRYYEKRSDAMRYEIKHLQKHNNIYQEQIRRFMSEATNKELNREIKEAIKFNKKKHKAVVYNPTGMQEMVSVSDTTMELCNFLLGVKFQKITLGANAYRYCSNILLKYFEGRQYMTFEDFYKDFTYNIEHNLEFNVHDNLYSIYTMYIRMEFGNTTEDFSNAVDTFDTYLDYARNHFDAYLISNNLA